eukprot:105019-Prymnesium_polylepis.1
MAQLRVLFIDQPSDELRACVLELQGPSDDALRRRRLAAGGGAALSRERFHPWAAEFVCEESQEPNLQNLRGSRTLCKGALLC